MLSVFPSDYAEDKQCFFNGRFIRFRMSLIGRKAEKQGTTGIIPNIIVNTNTVTDNAAAKK